MARRPLARPPSDRYVHGGGEVPTAGRPSPDGGASGAARGGWRPEIGAAVASVTTAVVLVVVGGMLGLTTGLVFVAGVGGAAVGLLLAGSPRSRSRLRVAAIALATGAVLVGAIGSWLIALAEGGALGLVDYVWATSGLLVPAEIAVAALAAAWGLGAGPITD